MAESTEDNDFIEKTRKRIKNIAARLIRLVELNAPGLILANDITLMFKLVSAAYPEDTGKALASVYFRPTLNYYGRCQGCQKEIAGQNLETLCMSCRLNEEMEFGDLG